MTTTKKNRNMYYYISERGFANEYDILIINDKEDEEHLEAIMNWATCSPNGYFHRIKRSELSKRDLEYAISIKDFNFSWQVCDGEEQGAKDYFNFRRWEDDSVEDEYEDEYEYEDRYEPGCGF